MPTIPLSVTPRGTPRYRWGVSLVLLTLLFTTGCAGGEGPGYRVAVIRYQHETCTFCPGGDTDVADWTRIRPTLTGEEVLEAGSYIRGFVDQARDYGDVELLGLTSPYEVFGGS